jgi:hypothetical protein
MLRSSQEARGVLTSHFVVVRGAEETNTGAPDEGSSDADRVLCRRADCGAINKAAAGAAWRGQNPGDRHLQPGDVLVVDLFGKIDKGTFIGDNLGTSIYAKTKKGVVVHGSVRDLSGILEIEGFHGFVRDFHPTALADTTLVGINVPVRIGGVTVLPGDVVLSDPEGLTFVPPQLAEKVVVSSEDVRFRDDWGHEMLRQGKYTPGQVDSKWTDAMEAEFQAWAKARRARTP